MKKIIITIALAFVTKFAYCQKNFEGSIQYALLLDDLDSAIWIYSTVYFKDHYILVSGDAHDSTSVVEDKLFNFDSGYIYEVDKYQKTITRSDIIQKTNILPSPMIYKDSARNIAGYNCGLAKYSYVDHKDGDSAEGKIWFANDLIFSLPEKYTAQSYCAFVNGGNICLLNIFTSYLTRNGKANLSLKADKVTYEILPDSLFVLPENYEMVINNAGKEMSGIKITQIKIDPSPPPPTPIKRKFITKRVIKKEKITP